MVAGFGGVLVAFVYGILIVPLIVLRLADRRKFLVWQFCILPFAAYVGIMNGFQAGVVLLFWAMETVLSSPVPIYLYWKRSRAVGGYRLAWVFIGLALVVLAGIVLLRDPFLLFFLSALWIAACLVKFALEWQASAESRGPKAATLVASGALLLLITATASFCALHKQETFRAAIESHHLRVARWLVHMGADPNLPDELGHTALVGAVWNGVGDLPAVNALISMGATVNQTGAGAFGGMLPSGTALDAAAAAGRTEICKTLLEAGASVDGTGTQGSTPLLAALSHASINLVPIFLAHGANVNARDGRGKTALMLLMQYGPEDPFIQGIVQELLARGADVNAKDVDGKSVEDWAAYYKHERFHDLLRPGK
jgi:ankyrin repeat protein